jgi:peptidoglycan hydrolase-like protein with peptidoglycan-binding domain
MNIKNKLIAALALAVFVLPSVSLGQTVSNVALQAQIQVLLAEVQQLQAQLAAQGGGTASCHVFNNNLSIGMTGSEVTALQTALNYDGYIAPGDSSLATNGIFDERTASAVVWFQEKNRSEILDPAGLGNGTGYVGKATRAKLNSLGCTGSNPVTSSSPYQNQSAQITSLTSAQKGWTVSLELMGRNPNWLPGDDNSGPFYIDQNKSLSLSIPSTAKAYACPHSANAATVSTPEGNLELTTPGDLIEPKTNSETSQITNTHPVLYFDISGGSVSAIYQSCTP